jgi:hypothetical protein
MEELLGSRLSVFIGLTVVIMGAVAFMTGQAVAATWRPAWQAVLYCFLLGLVDRFLTSALFGGRGLLVSGFIIDTAVLIIIGLIAYRLTHVAKMVTQYPWLYERAGIWNYRARGGAGE